MGPTCEPLPSLISIDRGISLSFSRPYLGGKDYKMTQNQNRPYIVKNEDGEEFLLPCYSAPFRVLMDDKETIRDNL